MVAAAVWLATWDIKRCCVNIGLNQTGVAQSLYYSREPDLHTQNARHGSCCCVETKQVLHR